MDLTEEETELDTDKEIPDIFSKVRLHLQLNANTHLYCNVYVKILGESGAKLL